MADEAEFQALYLLAAEAIDRQQWSISRRKLRDTMDPFQLTEEQFTTLFRVSKDIAHIISDAIRGRLRRQRTCGLSAELQVLTALRFFATGSYQRSVGQDFFVSLSQPAVSRAIKYVAKGIMEELGQRWIKFPVTDDRRNAIKRRFRETHGIKGVIGCIDCTQIAIVRPHIREEAYYNYKGFHSLNVQAVCSFDLEILSLNTRFPGSVHDSFIWRQSAIRQEMVGFWENGNKESWLLGDSGYPLEPWLMTPILDAAEGTAEARYTRAHSQTRNCVERMFGVLKNTFRCLLRHRVLHYQPPVVSAIIVACAVLHNMRKHHNIVDRVDGGDIEAERNEENNGVIRGERFAEAERVRAMLVRNF